MQALQSKLPARNKKEAERIAEHAPFSPPLPNLWKLLLLCDRQKTLGSLQPAGSGLFGDALSIIADATNGGRIKERRTL